MKLKVLYKLHFENEDKKYPHHPDEDAIAIRGNSIAVFDGVTLEHQNPYPAPSPAAEAAYIGARAAVEYANTHAQEEGFLKNSFVAANREILKLNQRLGITPQTVNYLDIQYAGSVGAIAAYEDATLHYSFINDCGIMVCSIDGGILKNATEDNLKVNEYLKRIRTEYGLKQNSPEEYRFVRQFLINNPDAELDGSPMFQGVLTGQEIAINFVRENRMKIVEPTIIIVYSDGFLPVLNDSGIRKKLGSINTEQEAYGVLEHARRELDSLQEASLVVATVT